MGDWWEYFRGEPGEEQRYQAFKDRLKAEEEGRRLDDELQAANERREQEEREHEEWKEAQREYFRKLHHERIQARRDKKPSKRRQT